LLARLVRWTTSAGSAFLSQPAVAVRMLPSTATPKIARSRRAPIGEQRTPCGSREVGLV
jgi:hypothetical protein